jgi:hypothetical protein
MVNFLDQTMGSGAADWIWAGSRTFTYKAEQLRSAEGNLFDLATFMTNLENDSTSGASYGTVDNNMFRTTSGGTVYSVIHYMFESIKLSLGQATFSSVGLSTFGLNKPMSLMYGYGPDGNGFDNRQIWTGLLRPTEVVEVASRDAPIFLKSGQGLFLRTEAPLGDVFDLHVQYSVKIFSNFDLY